MFRSRGNDPVYAFILVFLIICFGGRLADQIHRETIFGRLKEGDTYWVANPNGASAYDSPGGNAVQELRYNQKMELLATGDGETTTAHGIPVEPREDPNSAHETFIRVTVEGQEVWVRLRDVLRQNLWDYEDGARFIVKNPEGTAGQTNQPGQETVGELITLPYHTKLSLVGDAAWEARTSQTLGQIEIAERHWCLVQEIFLQVRTPNGKIVWVPERHLRFWE